MGALTRLSSAVALASAVLLGVAGNGDAALLKVSAVLDSDTVEFADPVTATVTVFLDREEDVSVRENLAPLTQLGPTRVTSATRGRLHTITYTTRASCLDERCISSLKRSKRIAFRPVVVKVAPNTTRKATWPLLVVQARVSRVDAARPRPPLRRDASAPPVTYRVDPAQLARALDVTAVVLAAAALLLGAWAAAALYRRRRTVAPLTGLERALALARDAERRPTPDRRRALGLLARLLGSRDARLADAADELAWSEPAPTSGELSALVTQVEREVNGP